METIHPLDGHTRKIASGRNEEGSGQSVKSFVWGRSDLSSGRAASPRPPCEAMKPINHRLIDID